MADASDDELLERYAAGDRGAFEALMNRHESGLFRYVRLLLGSAAASRIAEDVVQEAFVRLAAHPPHPPHPSRPGVPAVRLSAWLHTVARNRAMELIRSETRRSARERTSADSEVQHGTHEAGDTRRAVEEGLLGLPTDQREVLVLRLLEDKSYADIATLTGKRIGTVGWLISEGLKTLSRRLAPVFERERVPAVNVSRVEHPRGGPS